MVLDGKVVGKLERNIGDRVTNIGHTIGKEVDIGKTSVDELIGLKPVQSLVGLITETLDNLGDMVKTQASISRRWAE